MSKVKAALMCATMAVALVGCGKKAPAGQVVATVNGTEVTMQELNAEVAAANIPEGADKKLAQRALLQRIVDRKLVAQEAQKRGLDKTPEFVSQKSRLEETLLAQQFVKQQVSTLPQATAADLSKFMSDNPNVFAQREQLLVDQIRVQAPKTPTDFEFLKNVHTQDGVAAALAARQVPFQRGKSALDTAQLPEAVVKQIAGLPAGEPFVLPAGNILLINVVTGKSSAPIPEAQARVVAGNGFREKQAGSMLQDRVKSLRGAAKITYQPGFEPPPQTGAPAAPAAKPGS